jgi:hypothetical protein
MTGPASKRALRTFVSLLLAGAGAGCALLPVTATTHEVTLAQGTVLTARLDSAIGSDTSREGDTVEATLTEAVRLDGVEVLPSGSVLSGVVTTADASGKVKGRASLAVTFRSVALAGRSETYVLSARLHRTAESTKGDDAKKIGIPAAAGAGIGAIVGGKKGAGVGALIGGGAGTAVVLSTSGPEVRYAKGAAMSVALDQAVNVRVPNTAGSHQ